MRAGFSGLLKLRLCVMLFNDQGEFSEAICLCQKVWKLASVPYPDDSRLPKLKNRPPIKFLI
jgi:hypothetical protein